MTFSTHIHVQLKQLGDSLTFNVALSLGFIILICIIVWFMTKNTSVTSVQMGMHLSQYTQITHAHIQETHKLDVKMSGQK